MLHVRPHALQGRAVAGRTGGSGVRLDEHPAQLTIPELCRALYAKPGDFESNDVIERAVRDLVSCGLLNCEGPFVVPTKAARCYARLETS